MLTDLTSDVIEKVKFESVPMIKEAMGDDVKEIILYGSCARGDYNAESDIDIALLTRCSRLETRQYEEALAKISTEFAVKYFAIVNFVCFPSSEYDEKKTWYPYFKSIDREGVSLYGR